VISAGLKLDVYFGETQTAGRHLASDALMECFDRHGVGVGVLYRGIEGFGIGRRIHTARFPDISTDLPLIAEAIGTRERIQGMLDEVDSIVDKGLVTLEHSRVAIGEEVRTADFPVGVGSAARLTIYCGRGERSGNVPSYRAVVDLLRRQGASGATVLLGVDGIHNSQRRRAGLLSRNVNVPMAIVAVGAAHALARVLGILPDVLPRPIANLERIALVKHDGDLLEPLPLVDDSADGDPPVWMALRVYTRQSAQVEGGALYTTLTRRLREAGAAGITTVRGEWGFSSDEAPFGDRFATLTSHVPTYTVFIDRPRKVAELWPTVDEITAAHGVVTAALVPGYRERAGEVTHGRLTIGSPEGLAALVASGHPTGFMPSPVVGARVPSDPVTPEDHWARALLDEIGEYARARGRKQPLVRVTLADSESFFLAGLEPRPGRGFVTLYPHPPQVADLVPGEQGAALVPRALVVSLSGIMKVELLTQVPRGARSDVGFELPASAYEQPAGPSRT
jgi:PII-like signaling protein